MGATNLELKPVKRVVSKKKIFWKNVLKRSLSHSAIVPFKQSRVYVHKQPKEVLREDVKPIVNSYNLKLQIIFEKFEKEWPRR